MIDKGQISYQNDLKTIFSSAAGLRVLKRWREDFVYNAIVTPGIDTNPYTAMYALGQKELVSDFIYQLKDEKKLDEVTIEE